MAGRSGNPLGNSVADDLEYLGGAWPEGATEGELRRGSTILRRLLVAGDLVKALRGHPEPKIRCLDLDNAIRPNPREAVFLVTLGPTRYNGQEFGQWLIYNGNEPKTAPDRDTVISLDLTAYLDAPSLCFEGRDISRRSIIRYVANKLGGAHYDPERNRLGDEEFAHLDRLDAVNIDGYPPVYLEIQAIGQAVIGTPSIMGPFGLTPALYRLSGGT